MRQGLLPSVAADERMTFRYPLKIARWLLNVVSSLPIASIEVHGMGIFERIFETGNSMVDVMQAYGPQRLHEIYGICRDLFNMFVKTLSLTPNSQRRYAELLLAKVAEKPEIQRFSHVLTNGPFIGTIPGANGLNLNTSRHLGERQWRGSSVGEVKDGEDAICKAKEEEGYGQTKKRLME